MSIRQPASNRKFAISMVMIWLVISGCVVWKLTQKPSLEQPSLEQLSLEQPSLGQICLNVSSAFPLIGELRATFVQNLEWMKVLDYRKGCFAEVPPTTFSKVPMESLSAPPSVLNDDAKRDLDRIWQQMEGDRSGIIIVKDVMFDQDGRVTAITAAVHAPDMDQNVELRYHVDHTNVSEFDLPRGWTAILVGMGD